MIEAVRSLWHKIRRSSDEDRENRAEIDRLLGENVSTVNGIRRDHGLAALILDIEQAHANGKRAMEAAGDEQGQQERHSEPERQRSTGRPVRKAG